MKNLALKVCRFVNNSYICSAKKHNSSITYRSYFERTLRHIDVTNGYMCFLAENKGYALSFCININL
jgi:hypothetical protein